MVSEALKLVDSFGKIKLLPDPFFLTKVKTALPFSDVEKVENVIKPTVFAPPA